MKLGIVIYSNDAELVWNAFRFANLAVEQKDEVKIFFLAKGVEYETLSNEKYTITELAHKFIGSGGKILACGTCLKLRHKDGSQLCPISTMKDLYQLIKESDKIVTF
ncbi:MAG: sulfur reduction protein DsrE [Elusimicrobia bacterium RIFOXYC2_FULL_34_12]|nr:MAG: sulfur reduction protein DsrE [Elusimicrobia bacterium RIFOXYC2_FULL_34_12]OGS38614.1 MAG: sulfur reduction protein DsrE [Elusimicrobia bacterium RIFOXYD2_FULL_34_30]HAM38073.1 sulfur reduction protein DsrE [Elusimicrobiota bacterium]